MQVCSSHSWWLFSVFLGVLCSSLFCAITQVLLSEWCFFVRWSKGVLYCNMFCTYTSSYTFFYLYAVLACHLSFNVTSCERMQEVADGCWSQQLLVAFVSSHTSGCDFCVSLAETMSMCHRASGSAGSPKAEEFSAFFYLLWCNNKPNVFTSAGPFNDCNWLMIPKLYVSTQSCGCMNFVGKIPGVWRCNKIKFVWLQSGQQILWSVHYYSALTVCSTLFCETGSRSM